ncbi:MAG: peptidoglycan DD-metalloendopeptidase family protein [Acidimicrobiia bacterium]
MPRLTRAAAGLAPFVLVAALAVTGGVAGGDPYHDSGDGAFTSDPDLGTTVPTTSTTIVVNRAAVRQAQSMLDEAIGAERDLVIAYEASIAARDQLQTDIESLDLKITAQTVEVARAEVRQVAAEQELVGVQLELTSAINRVHVAENELRDLAVNAYVSGHRLSLAAGMVDLLNHGGQGLQDVQVGATYARTTIDKQERTLAAVEAARVQAAILRTATDTKRVDAAQVAEQAATLRYQLERDRQSRLTKKNQVEIELGVQQGLIAQARSLQAQYAARVDALRGDSRAVTELLARRVGDGPMPTEKLKYPLPGYPIASPFGIRVHPIYGDERLHEGVDIDAEAGRAILAAGSGEVVWAGERSGYGLVVIIDHGGGLVTMYAHTARTYVQPGQTVEAGDRIAAVGETGDTTGPHLHFEVRIKGVPVDPVKYLATRI